MNNSPISPEEDCKGTFVVKNVKVIDGIEQVQETTIRTFPRSLIETKPTSP